jgi:hypothetical protein
MVYNYLNKLKNQLKQTRKPENKKIIKFLNKLGELKLSMK